MVTKFKKAGSYIVEHRARFATTFICFVLCAANLFLTVSGANTVKVYYNGEEHEISTYRTSADDVLEQSRLDIDPETCFIDTSLFEEYGIISVEPLNEITVIDGESKSVIKGHGLLKDILAANDITLGEYDKVEGGEADSYIENGSTITIKRAHSVMISADGEVTTVYLTEGTVADALNIAVITADDDDIISAPLDTKITENTSIKITRIEYKERKDVQTIKYTTKKEETGTLNAGQSKVKQAGVDGEKVFTYEDKYVDGKLEESTLKNTETTKEAVEEILLVGTNRSTAVFAAEGGSTGGQGAKTASGVRTISVMTPPASLELTSDNIPVSYKKKYVGNATAYHCGTHTSTGAAVRPGVVAVNPNQIPYHTKMWIVSNDGKFVYGYCSAEDTGGFIYFTGKKATLCDLYMPSLDACTDFGRRAVTIYIL